MTAPRFLLALSSFAALACAGCIDTLDLDHSGADASGSGTSSAASTTGPQASTTTAADSDGSSSSTTDGSSGAVDAGSDSSTGEPPPASVCDPQPEYETDLRIRLELPDGFADDLTVDASCVVDGVIAPEPDAREPEHRVVLRCSEAELEVERVVLVRLGSLPATALPFEVGASVRLRVVLSVFIDTPGWQELAVHDPDDALLLGRYDGEPAPDGIDVAPWFAPFATVLDTSVCGIDAAEPPDEGGSFIIDGCAQDQERAAWHVDSPWGEATVYDRRSEMLGPYLLRVPFAATSTLAPFAEAGCNPTPQVRAQIVFVRVR